jgi:hypothetical protein
MFKDGRNREGVFADETTFASACEQCHVSEVLKGDLNGFVMELANLEAYSP